MSKSWGSGNCYPTGTLLIGNRETSAAYHANAVVTLENTKVFAPCSITFNAGDFSAVNSLIANIKAGNYSESGYALTDDTSVTSVVGQNASGNAAQGKIILMYGGSKCACTDKSGTQSVYYGTVYSAELYYDSDCVFGNILYQYNSGNAEVENTAGKSVVIKQK